jgi:hypothetical protein
MVPALETPDVVNSSGDAQPPETQEPAANTSSSEGDSPRWIQPPISELHFIPRPNMLRAMGPYVGTAEHAEDLGPSEAAIATGEAEIIAGRYRSFRDRVNELRAPRNG